MIVPSIDLMDGRAVQLEGGKELKIDAGEPGPIAERFARAGQLAVIDLDAALGKGDNEGVMRELVGRYDCRVGGGIRSVERAVEWLNAGARSVILGTAAREEVLRELPRERVIAALDAVHGEVVVEGWTKGTGRTVLDRIAELREHVGGFLVTFVEREGRMTGLPEEEVAAVVEAAGPGVRVTVAGGVASAGEIAAADRLGADVQVGMSLYSGRVGLGECVASVFRSDRQDGLVPTVVCDERRVALGLVYSSAESMAKAVDEGVGVYFSRSRGGLWEKGASSGQRQRLIRVEADCDRDAARFVVRQDDGAAAGGGSFCHLGTRTCFDGATAGSGGGMGALMRTLAERMAEARRGAAGGSYTAKLVADAELLRAKLHEEVDELMDEEGREGAVREAADVLYFALVRAAAAGVGLDEIEREFEMRSRRVTRRSATESNSTRPRGMKKGESDVE